MTTYQTVKPKDKHGLKIAGRLVLFVALRYGPAGVAGWVVKSVARRPLKMLLALAIEPLLASLLRNISLRLQKRRTK